MERNSAAGVDVYLTVAGENGSGNVDSCGENLAQGPTAQGWGGSSRSAFPVTLPEAVVPEDTVLLTPRSPVRGESLPLRPHLWDLFSLRFHPICPRRGPRSPAGVRSQTARLLCGAASRFSFQIEASF